MEAIITAVGVGGIVGIFVRLTLRMHPFFGAIIAATTDNPFIITALCGAVSVLFGALTKVALELMRRTDKAHAEIVNGLT